MLEMKLFRCVFTVYLHLRQGFLDTRRKPARSLDIKGFMHTIETEIMNRHESKPHTEKDFYVTLIVFPTKNMSYEEFVEKFNPIKVTMEEKNAQVRR
jgi:hypothetical protein